MRKLLPVCFILVSYVSLGQQPGLGLSFLPYQESINNINCQNGLCGTSPLVFYQQIAVSHYHFGRTTAVWWNADSTYNFFNQNQRDSVNVTYVFNRSTGQWMQRRRLIYSYDNNGIETASSVLIWDTVNNTWRNFDQVQYTHDANGLLANYVFLSWDNPNSRWIPLQETTEYYNDRGNVMENITERYDTVMNKWVNLGRVVNDYNDRGKNDTSTEFSWTDKWVGYERYIREYDLAGNDTQTIKQLWENTSMGSEGWVNYTKDNYTYNEAALPVLHTGYIWDAFNKIFKPASKDDHVYDFYNNDTLYETYVADTVNLGWIPYMVTSKYYDNNNNKTIEDTRGYNVGSENYDPQERYYYYYNTLEGAGSYAEHDSIAGITFSPNISTGSHELILTVDLDQQAQLVVNVFDMSGNLLQSNVREGSTGVNEFFLQLNNLNSGMYEIQVANTQSKASSVVKLMIP